MSDAKTMSFSNVLPAFSGASCKVSSWLEHYRAIVMASMSSSDAADDSKVDATCKLRFA